jgi:hypothetical protein
LSIKIYELVDVVIFTTDLVDWFWAPGNPGDITTTPSLPHTPYFSSIFPYEKVINTPEFTIVLSNIPERVEVMVFVHQHRLWLKT